MGPNLISYRMSRTDTSDEDSSDHTGSESEIEDVLVLPGEEDGGQLEAAGPSGKQHRDVAPVWRHGGQKLKDGTAKCCLCSYSMIPKKANTSNLTRHIVKRHPKSEEAKALKAAVKVKRKQNKENSKKETERRQSQSSMLTFINRQSHMTKAKKEEIDKVLMQHLVCSNSPFSEVEEHSFRNLMFHCNPDYIVPSERTISRMIDEQNEKMKELLKKEIKEEIGKTYHKTVAITFDHGTSGDRFHSKKLGVSLHYVNSVGVLKAETLCAVKCVGSQTGPVVRETIKAKLVEVGWEEDWRVLCTTDGASNMVSARTPGRHQVKTGMLETFVVVHVHCGSEIWFCSDSDLSS